MPHLDANGLQKINTLLSRDLAHNCSIAIMLLKFKCSILWRIVCLLWISTWLL